MKLIVVDGVDASGKETHTKYIYNLLSEVVDNVKKISFPDYDSPSSSLVKMYLGGEFGDSPNDVNAYAASSFYAVDRYASFKKDWGKDFETKNGIIVADRYTTSNMIHQASKISSKKEKDKFLDWIADFEYNKLGLPKPYLVIFLNMPTWAAEQLMANRKNKITGEAEKDVHEKDAKFMVKSYENAMYVAKKFGWTIVDCTEGDRIKSIEEIQKEIKKIIL
jgi:dTMP kinase